MKKNSSLSPAFVLVTSIALVFCLFAVRAVAGTPSESDAAEIISFYQDFDGGSLNVAETRVENPEGSEPVITLASRVLPSRNRWYTFDLIGAEGKRPIFRAPLAGRGRGSHVDGYQYYFSMDGGKTYSFFPPGKRDDKGEFFVFQPDDAFTQETIRISYSIPYPVARTAAHTRRVGKSRWVSATPSANADFVIAYTPGTAEGGYTDELGREIPPLELLGYQITDPSVPADEKMNAVFMSGNHSAEATAHWTLEGVVDFLISEDPRAAELRREIVFHVYPQVNPEGRWAGYNRASPEHPRLNHNRDWVDFRNTSARIIDQAIRADTDGSAVLFIDFHSHRDGLYAIWDFEGGEKEPFFAALQRYRPELEFTVFTTPRSASAWGKREETIHAKYSFTSETGFNPGWTRDDYRALGRDYGIAFFDILSDLRAAKR